MNLGLYFRLFLYGCVLEIGFDSLGKIRMGSVGGVFLVFLLKNM